ncbi:hypothetical protein VBH83_02775 [Ochrobactrum sp. S1502_03]
MKNNIKIHEYKGNLSTGNKGGESFTADEISRGAFLYTRSSTGIDIYTPEDIVALILLEPVRNLRWKFPEGGENT